MIEKRPTPPTENQMSIGPNNIVTGRLKTKGLYLYNVNCQCFVARGHSGNRGRYHGGHQGASIAGASSGGHSRSSSLPRTFQREALLRHPELSMEMDRLASPDVATGILPPHLSHAAIHSDDPLSDSGAISAPESVLSARKRGGNLTFQISIA